SVSLAHTDIHSFPTRRSSDLALGKFVVAQSGMSLEDYIKENKVEDVPNFTDVPDNYVDSELVMYSKIVKEAGIFEGSNNNLMARDRKSTRFNSSHVKISYAVF